MSAGLVDPSEVHTIRTVEVEMGDLVRVLQRREDRCRQRQQAFAIPFLECGHDLVIGQNGVDQGVHVDDVTLDPQVEQGLHLLHLDAENLVALCLLAQIVEHDEGSHERADDDHQRKQHLSFDD